MSDEPKFISILKNKFIDSNPFNDGSYIEKKI
jgi:hypothetical protein